MPTWIHAGTQHAEAGFEDPALGWVGVRADMSAGGVHASLLPGSAEAAQALGGHIAGLQAFLADQHTPVESLTMATHQNSGMAFNAGQGAMQQGTGQQGGGQHQRDSASSNQQASPLTATESMPPALPQSISSQIGIPIVSFPGPGGAHISVMA
jgi:hypothetical protein